MCSALLRWWVVLLISCRLKLLTGEVNKSRRREITAVRLLIAEFIGEFPVPGRALESFIPIGWVTSYKLKNNTEEYCITLSGPNLSAVCVRVIFGYKTGIMNIKMFLWASVLLMEINVPANFSSMQNYFGWHNRTWCHSLVLLFEVNKLYKSKCKTNAKVVTNLLVLWYGGKKIVGGAWF